MEMHQCTTSDTNIIDRKIRCDLGFPRCLNCKKSKRICPGYGLRLSWPRANDPKRFVIGEAPTKTSRIRRLSKLYLVNASVLDIEIFYHLSMPEQFTKPRILTYLPWSPSKLRGEEMDLLEYCKCKIWNGTTMLFLTDAT